MTKNIDKLTSPAAPSPRDRHDPDHAVIGHVIQLNATMHKQMHHHTRGQLIHAPTGAVRVTTEVGNWSVPVNQAVWIPGGIQHTTIAMTTLSVNTLFIDASCAHTLPQQCQVVSLSPLMRELLQRAVEIGDDYPTDSAASRLMAVILDELRTLTPEPLYLPIAQDRLVRKIMDALMDNPSDQRGLEQWAMSVGASARTLARRFVKETGFSFGQWRTRLRLIEGLERLQQGHSVTNVAMEVGYANSSAFITMFQRELGMLPSRVRPSTRQDAARIK